MAHRPVAFDARRTDRRVRLAMRILEFEQTAAPTLEDLASRVGLSPFRLSHLFREEVGESCAAYGRRIRLDNSNHQIIHEGAPLDVVAATFGYASQAAYTRAYTRQFGRPPRQHVAAVLGESRADIAQSNLGPVGSPPVDALLAGRVGLAQRPDRPALARRFYGHDLLSHWRAFLADLPKGLQDGAALAGMAYDNVRITPPHRWRYDCALVFGPEQPLPPVADTDGLDPVLAPGGLHAETTQQGGFADVWRATVGLLSMWLPARSEYVPEGDPLVHWLHDPPLNDRFPSTATLRVRLRGTPPAYNLLPLDERGRPAGARTDPASV